METESLLQQQSSSPAPGSPPQRRAMSGRSQESGPVRIPRALGASQLDSLILQADVESMLRMQWKRIFALASPVFRDDFQADLEALFSLFLFRYTLWTNYQTYSDKLLDISYRIANKEKMTLANPSRLRLLCYAVVTVGIPYCYQKFVSLQFTNAKIIERAHLLLEILNRYLFLWTGEFRTVADRVCQMRLLPVRTATPRIPYYDFLHRQLVWKTFSEFALFVYPLIKSRICRVRTMLLRTVFRTLRSPKHDRGQRLSSQDTLAPTTGASTIPRQCHACEASPTKFPCAASCGHVFCYMCIAGSVEANPDAACPVCYAQCSPIRLLFPAP
eukprot:ANDGO_05690.mRNA.1 Peroxisome biogenesis factor 2